jgi:hypothetical protein
VQSIQNKYFKGKVLIAKDLGLHPDFPIFLVFR